MEQVNPQVAELLGELNEIFEPSARFELAAGWWLLGLALIVGIGLLVYSNYQKWKQNTYRRLATQSLNSLSQAPDVDFANGVNRLLKQLAIEHFGRPAIAPLHGSAWTEFLKAKSPDTNLPENVEHLLKQGLYESNPKIDKDDLQQFVSHWIQHHRKSPHAVDGARHV